MNTVQEVKVEKNKLQCSLFLPQWNGQIVTELTVQLSEFRSLVVNDDSVNYDSHSPAGHKLEKTKVDLPFSIAYHYLSALTARERNWH